uniref:(northern house mosquito) hypothetical protein n=1 Tax=Culex pipiens TaxID=7175 RepID=A0A8D8CNI5_CULPI
MGTTQPTQNARSAPVSKVSKSRNSRSASHKPGKWPWNRFYEKALFLFVRLVTRFTLRPETATRPDRTETVERFCLMADSERRIRVSTGGIFNCEHHRSVLMFIEVYLL